MPEFNGGLELFDIVVPDTDRKRVEKKLGIGLPCMAFGKCQIAVTERLGLSVDSAKICAPDAADKLRPYFRVDDTVQVEAFFA